ncbi:MAG: ELM1/GtrOC1 family putative glycosyltransferase, partial [Rhodanobacteraceae bacterium]
GSVLATTSRRTPHAFAARVRDALAALPGTFWTGGGANPYPGILGWADRIVVTADSVNMLSEACATGVPVHVAAAAPLPPALVHFHAALRERGLLSDPGNDHARVPPLREAQAVAAALRARMAARVR